VVNAAATEAMRVTAKRLLRSMSDPNAVAPVSLAAETQDDRTGRPEAETAHHLKRNGAVAGVATIGLRFSRAVKWNGHPVAAARGTIRN